MNTEQTPAPASTIRHSILVSVVIGGVLGGVIGFVASSVAGDQAADWFDRSFGTEASDTSTSASNSTATQKLAVSQIEEESATIDTVAKVSQSVGSIIVKRKLDALSENTSPFDLFFGPQGRTGQEQISAGTGFVISEDGYILTNKHVIDATEAAYTFITNDGKQYDAALVDTDPLNDVAVMKIEATGLPYVELGDSDLLKIGQTVIAIGNSLNQFPNTVTKGVISGIGRTITAGNGQGQSETIEEVIQTDAAINSGNSGGPLLTLDGKVIGINTAVSQEGQLIGFAIPIDQVIPAVQSVREQGKIVRPYIGIRYQLITADLAKANNLSVEYGALIVAGGVNELGVIPGSPADKAGLETNDIILELNGQKIEQNNTLSKMMKRFSIGDTITLKVLHDGEEKTVTATLEELTNE